jgi:NADH:ubiquinone oxidoreductase subunit E
MYPTQIDWETLSAIIKKHEGAKWGLIPLLQEIQEHFGYIPPDAITPIAEAMNLFPSQVQGVIMFYAGLSMEAKGKYVIRVCRGTACHVKGSHSIVRMMQKELNLKEGETSSDFRFTFETVACLGACALAPTMMVNKTYFGRLTPPKVTATLEEYSKSVTKEPV